MTVTGEPARSEPEAAADLAGATFTALKWRYAGVIVQAILQFAIGVVLARLLPPEAFGLVAIALIVTGFGRLVGDFGFGAALIQYPRLTEKHVRAAITGTMVICATMAALLWCLAPTISNSFGQGDLVWIVRAIGISLVSSGVSVTVISLLRRELQFRRLAIIESISYAVGFGVVGISMAVMGYGVWSLAIATIVQSLCLVLSALYSMGRLVLPYMGYREYRDLFPVASAELLNNIANFSADNLQFIIIGRWLGAGTLGLYNRSFHLMDLPVRYLSVALGSVMFPVYAKIQGDVPRLAKAFLLTASITSAIATPVFLSMAASSDIIIIGLFGEQWRESTRALQILSLSGPFLAMMRVFGAVSHARGYVFNEFKRQMVYLILMGIVLWIMIPYGLEGIALGVTISIIVRYALLAHLSLRLLQLSWLRFVSSQVPGYFIGVCVAGSAYAISLVLSMAVESYVLRLIAVAVVSTTSLILILRLSPARWLGEWYPWLVKRVDAELPAWVRHLIIGRVFADSVQRGT